MPPKHEAPARRRSAPKRSRAAKRSLWSRLKSIRFPSIDFAALSGRASFTMRLLGVGVVILDVFLAASFFSGWTGSLGRLARTFLTSTLGGASLVPIIFSGYIAMSIATRRKIPQPISQTAGAISLFFCTALLLGLAAFGHTEPASFPIFEPGAIGVDLAHWLYENTGPLGTTLIGFAGGCLTLVFFGYVGPFSRLMEAISSFADMIASMIARLMNVPRGRHTDEPQNDENEEEMQDEEVQDEEVHDDDEYEDEYEDDVPDEEQDSPAPMQNIQTANGKYLYVNEPDEVIRERSRALLEQARELTAAREARESQAQNADAVQTQTSYADEQAAIEMSESFQEQRRNLLAALNESRAPKAEPEVISKPIETQIDTANEDRSEAVRSIPQEKIQETPIEIKSEIKNENQNESQNEVFYSPPRETVRETQIESAIETSQTNDLPSPVDVVQVDEMEYDASIRAKKGLFPPPVELYGDATDFDGGITQEAARPWGERIIECLAQFGIEAELADILIGPTVIQFRIQPLPGVKVNKIVALSNDLALALAVASLRIEAPIPSMPYVGIEIPNPKRRGITLRSVIENPAFRDATCALPLPMGVTINGDALVIGLESLPHMLIAGTTGSGKSVFVNACIVGLCSMRTPSELKMLLVDPKKVELAVYETLPHLLAPPVTDAKKAVHALAWAVREMDERYSLFASAKVRNIASYNEAVLPKDRIPHIVIVIDELAELMMTAAKEVEEYICRLAQMARAVGIHLMLATQRPSVDVVTGLIKANVPSRVAFTLAQMNDSRTIIDMGGAEKLLGKGDMLFTYTQSPKPMRVQSPWIDEQAIMKWLAYLTNLFGEPQFTDLEAQGDGPGGADDGAFDDPLLEDAVRTVMATGMASASGLQRRLSVGYTRAARLVDMMELAGIVGPSKGAKPRDILMDESEAEDVLASIKEQRMW